MRKFLLLALVAMLGACELQPGPRPGASVQTPPAPAPPAPTPPPPAPVDAAPTNVKVVAEITPPCLDVAIHVAGVIIASADPAQRSIFETERDRIVRSTGEVCTAQRWSDAAIRCYKGSSTQVALKECELKFPTQPVQRQQPKAIDMPVPTGGKRPEPRAPRLPAAGSAAR